MYARYPKRFEDSRSFQVYRASFYVWMIEATRHNSERLQIERFQLIWIQDKDKMYLR